MLSVDLGLYGQRSCACCFPVYVSIGALYAALARRASRELRIALRIFGKSTTTTVLRDTEEQVVGHLAHIVQDGNTARRVKRSQQPIRDKGETALGEGSTITFARFVSGRSILPGQRVCSVWNSAAKRVENVWSSCRLGDWWPHDPGVGRRRWCRLSASLRTGRQNGETTWTAIMGANNAAAAGVG